MPGYKITMLPDDVVQTYTLDEGRANPAVSLYVTIDEATLEITGTETAWSACPWPPTCATTSSTTSSPKNGCTDPSIQHRKHPQRLLDLREQLSFLYRLAKAPQGPARSGARQARELQPPGLQLPPASATTAPSPQGTSRCRSACASAARRST
jgi:hypothetical protein